MPVALFWVGCIVVCRWIARRKNRSGSEGIMMGILLGPIGCLVEMCLPDVESFEEFRERRARERERERERYTEA